MSSPERYPEADPAADPAAGLGPVIALEAVEVAELVPARRFCGRCGATLVEGETCLPCSPPASPGPGAGDQRIPRNDRGLPASLQASLLLYFLLLSVSLVMVGYTVATEQELSTTADLVATSIFSGIIVLFALRYGTSLAPLLGRLGPLRYYGVAVLTSFATFLIASGVVWALEMLGMESYRYSDGYVQEGWGWWAPVLSIAVLPAVFEEIAFRGLIPQSLGRYLTVREATLVSAGLFAVLHLSVPSVPHLFLMGIVLAALCRWSGSLYPAMLLHFCHNGLVVVAEQWEVIGPW